MKRPKFIDRILVWAVAACMTAGIAGCYDDSGIRALLENQESRLAVLEQACTTINSNIASLQAVLNALQQNKYVSAVNPVIESGKMVGYCLIFTDGSTVTLYHGTDGADGTDGRDGRDGRDGVDGIDGADGVAPVIGVRQDEDGSWYWTLNGEWLLDRKGNKVKAVGNDGADGKDGKDGRNGYDGVDGRDGFDGRDGRDGRDGTNGYNGTDGSDGVTPQLKIVEGYWYLSLDNGQTWTSLGKSTGADGIDGKDGVDGKDGIDGDRKSVV